MLFDRIVVTVQVYPKTQVGYSQCTSTLEKTCIMGQNLCAGCNHCEFSDTPEQLPFLPEGAENDAKPF
jgi:hypothetical protein